MIGTAIRWDGDEVIIPRRTKAPDHREVPLPSADHLLHCGEFDPQNPPEE